MTVLFVCALPPERSSVIGRLLPLALAAHEAGHTVSVLTLSGSTRPPFASTEDRFGVALNLVGPNIRATERSSPGFGETLVRFLAGLRALDRSLRSTQADVLVLCKPQLQNTTPALAAARRMRCPLLLDVDDLEAEASRAPHVVGWVLRTLEAKAARAASVITCASPFLVDRFRSLHRTARVELLPTGIEPRPTSPVHFRERLGIPREEKLILYVGSLSLSSGHRVDALLEAFERFMSSPSAPPARLILAGDGLDEHELRARAARSPHAARIRFLGRFTPPLDLALAREADLLVDPVDRTPSNEAKSSHRTMLALATGTPIVAGDVGIRRTLLPPALHEPCLYNPADPGALPAALARGLADDFAPYFRAASEGRITRCTWNALGAQFCSLLDDLAETRAGSTRMTGERAEDTRSP